MNSILKLIRNMKKIKHINEQKNRCDSCNNKFIYTSKCVKCDKTTCGASARQGYCDETFLCFKCENNFCYTCEKMFIVIDCIYCKPCAIKLQIDTY